MTIPAWSIPLALTLAIWAWPLLKAPYVPRGDYDFGGAIRGLAELAVCIIGTLVFWLVYFMWRAA